MTEQAKDAIVPAQIHNTSIEYMGERSLVKEMAYRLRYMLVGGKRLSDDECIAWTCPRSTATSSARSLPTPLTGTWSSRC